MGRYSNKNRNANTITISSYGAAGYVNYIEEDFWANDVCLSVFPNEEVLNKKYLYYVLKSKQQYIFDNTTKAIPDHIPTRFFEELPIPIPPLEVQSEIVRILDIFTELTEELIAELAHRKEQYEYYRERLLSEGEEVKLSEVASYVSERIDAATVTEDSYIGVDNLLQNRGGKVKSEHVPIDGRIAGYRPDDILVGNIRPYLKKIWFSDCSGGTNGDVLVIRSNDPQRTFPRFLYHVLASDRFFNYDNGNSKGSKMPRGNKEAIMNYGFVLPALKDQIRIANILDKYDALCSDKLIGLPAEISARQKQYEFYRDKLLSLGA